MRCDELRIAISQYFFFALELCFGLSLRCDLNLRERNTKALEKIFFWDFRSGSPLRLTLLLMSSEEGGLLVTTTMAIHCEEPVISACSIAFSLPKQKNFRMSKFRYGQIEYIMPYPINDILFQPFSIPIVFFLRLCPCIYISHYLVF